ncbi:hypothetical protein N782_00975 [Pontibacillus yanchengensis Y32]|uniref:Uncharacterized protein n=1 Tax=Pontibacillus yanchengensis Y32 TaxID=1385514 RepID=A0A0A2TGE1_9BACI|nr:hypothetical protein N782_00975 [Pontibacillus yanchengensis Y32]
MGILQYFIGPIIVFLIMHPIFSTLYKNVEKKDKGFVLSYYRLTHRGKLIRSLWVMLFLFLIFPLHYWGEDLTRNELPMYATNFLLVFVIDILYNYTKWKKHENINFL